jgi:transcriptional regulator with XRE-family HTH domain
MTDRLKELRKMLGLNQSNFAGQICISQTALSMMESGKMPLSERNIRLICTTFNVNERWLRTGEGDMFAAPSPLLAELLSLFDRLSPGTQDFLVEMARSLLRRQEGEEEG